MCQDRVDALEYMVKNDFHALSTRYKEILEASNMTEEEKKKQLDDIRKEMTEKLFGNEIITPRAFVLAHACWPRVR